MNESLCVCFLKNYITAVLTAVGASNLQYVDLNSPRNMLVFGMSLFVGLALPSWMTTNQNLLETSRSWTDNQNLLETSRSWTDNQNLLEIGETLKIIGIKQMFINLSKAVRNREVFNHGFWIIIDIFIYVSVDSGWRQIIVALLGNNIFMACMTALILDNAIPGMITKHTTFT